MGLFKQIKDLKATVAAAPEMIEQSQKLAANAQAMAAQQQAAAAAAMAQQQAVAATQAAVGEDFEPVEGVSIELWVEISKGLAAYNYDQSKAPELAADKGIPAESWQIAVDTWNARLKANPAVAQRFNALYTGRA